jgi:hypothetical protein
MRGRVKVKDTKGRDLRWEKAEGLRGGEDLYN